MKSIDVASIYLITCGSDLLSVFLSGIIPSRFISNIVPDGRFSASNVDSTTQVVMMDEWTSDSLSCEDAKRLLQGKLSLKCIHILFAVE